MEKQETIADIIAEMRKSDCDEICPWWADGGSCDFCPLGRSGKNCSFSNYANRFEAALGREKATTKKSLVVDDCAKLREALQQAKVAILAARKKMGVDNPIILEIIDAALAAPARNCDRFATLEDARKEHHKICEEYGACNKACGYKSGHSGTYQCFEAWLFAPATEQKGGNDANK